MAGLQQNNYRTLSCACFSNQTLASPITACSISKWRRQNQHTQRILPNRLRASNFLLLNIKEARGDESGVDTKGNAGLVLVMSDENPVRGRGAVSNPANRFERLHLERDPDVEMEAQPAPQTQFLKDKTASVLTHNDSPDVGFDTSINPYRGCEHGCIYCYARPTHEYLGFSAGLDFETRILIKENAPELLRRELSSSKWKPREIALSSATDCYQPAERRLRVTRRCLEVLAECRNPVGLITKNFLVTRDIDLLQELARHQAVTVCLSITSMDAELARVLEPRTSTPRQRFAAIETLAKAGVPVGVLVAPVIPALTDHDMIRIIRAAAAAGARFAAYEVLRLPDGVKELFEEWLTVHAPGQKEKVLNRIRAIRSGKLNDSQFNTRMVGNGVFAEQIAKTFKVACHQAGLSRDFPAMSCAAFRRPQGTQLSFF